MDPFKSTPNLLPRFRQGEMAALQTVYEAFEPPLRAFIVRGFAFRSSGRQLFFSGFREHDLEDIIQESFRRAFAPNARRSFDGLRPYKNYLFTIARNLIITELTARQRRIPVGEAPELDGVSAEAPQPISGRPPSSAPESSTEAKVENLEVYGLIMGFVEGLSEEESCFFEHRFLAQRSQEKTALLMGVKRAHVRKLEAKLRRAFLCHMRGAGYLETKREMLKVRRVEDPGHHAAVFARSRSIWRERRAEQPNEFLLEAV